MRLARVRRLFDWLDGRQKSAGGLGKIEFAQFAHPKHRRYPWPPLLNGSRRRENNRLRWPVCLPHSFTHLYTPSTSHPAASLYLASQSSISLSLYNHRKPKKKRGWTRLRVSQTQLSISYVPAPASYLTRDLSCL